VGYRDWLASTARSMSLIGWVRNRRDGSVEIHAQGRQADLDAMVERCRRGPPAARVDEVRIRPVPPEDLTGFHRAATA
jgi:acylphosphatase